MKCLKETWTRFDGARFGGGVDGRDDGDGGCSEEEHINMRR